MRTIKFQPHPMTKFALIFITMCGVLTLVVGIFAGIQDDLERIKLISTGLMTTLLMPSLLRREKWLLERYLQNGTLPKVLLKKKEKNPTISLEELFINWKVID